MTTLKDELENRITFRTPLNRDEYIALLNLITIEIDGYTIDYTLKTLRRLTALIETRNLLTYIISMTKE